MKDSLHSRDGASKGAALMIVLALVVLSTGLALAFFTRTSTDRQLTQSSYNDTSADLLARTALDIVVGDFKQEIVSHPTVTPNPPNCYITPVPYGTPAQGQTAIPNLIRRSFFGDPSGRTSTVNSGTASANGRSISLARWNNHYLIPRANTSIAIDSTPVSSFLAPDWVLITAQGPNTAPAPSHVIGRYAFAVYDEGGLLDMNLAGYPSWSGLPNGACSPAPTPWLVNVGRKGTLGFADLTALGTYAPSPSPVDKIVGWRNYATTQRTFTNFPDSDPGFGGETDCTKQNNYGSYLLYFGDPPFTIESLLDKLAASLYPFTAVATQSDVSNRRTDQSLITRQQLLRLRSSLGFSQNVLQYMGTFSRERNQPAPDWPNLSGHLSDGRFNLNNLALVVPNPDDCNTTHGKKKGWQTGKNRNHICGTPTEVIELFGLFWVKAEVLDTNLKTPGHWRYIYHTGPNPPGDPNPNYNSIICWDPNANRNQARQVDFFQLLNYALNVGRGRTDHCGGTIDTQARTFGIGASLIDQYDSGSDCQTNPAGPGCDLDLHVNSKYRTHTTVIEYGQGNGDRAFAFGMEPNRSTDSINGDDSLGTGGSNPHLPCGGQGGDCASGEPPAPTPLPGTQVISHAFSNVGEFGYGVDTSAAGLPTMDFSSPSFPDAPVLDFFSYNPISSAYPRAGIVNLYTRNEAVIAAMLSSTWKTDAASANPTPAASPSGRVSTFEALTAAHAIVQETQNVLSGSAAYGPVTQIDMTRAIAARLSAAGGSAVGITTEQKQAIARALAEMGQTRTWNLFIDVIAQTGKYKPNSIDLTGSNFVVEGEKRYWLHIALGRDLIQADGTPCLPGAAGCQVDVLGTQLEEVIE